MFIMYFPKLFRGGCLLENDAGESVSSNSRELEITLTFYEGGIISGGIGEWKKIGVNTYRRTQGEGISTTTFNSNGTITIYEYYDSDCVLTRK